MQNLMYSQGKKLYFNYGKLPYFYEMVIFCYLTVFFRHPCCWNNTVCVFLMRFFFFLQCTQYFFFTVYSCGMGSRCAMKFGPRIGKLCDCGQGANCNSYLLKCI
uniref:Uncharacterized protein n=1 Tax=Sphaeramia orbicularis TaxID=375764 RepID=A0A672Z980_9TELE